MTPPYSAEVIHGKTCARPTRNGAQQDRKESVQGIKYTAGQAAKATGVATATITRALKSGKISGQKDENGSWVIDPAELHRVFPPVSQKEHESSSMKQNATPYEAPERAGEIRALEREVLTLRDALSDAREDRDKWRDMAERLALASPEKSPAPAPKPGFWSRLLGKG